MEKYYTTRDKGVNPAAKPYPASITPLSGKQALRELEPKGMRDVDNVSSPRPRPAIGRPEMAKLSTHTQVQGCTERTEKERCVAPHHLVTKP